MPIAPKRHKNRKHAKLHDPRPSSSARGYDYAWQKVRALKLEEQPLCEVCLRAGRTTPACDVDHIQPIIAGGERLEMANLQSICRRCHNRKTRGQ